MTIFIATLETTNFTFEAFGERPGDALKAMQKGWTVHRREYKALDRWDDVESDVRVRPVEFGKCYRDGEGEAL